MGRSRSYKRHKKKYIHYRNVEARSRSRRRSKMAKEVHDSSHTRLLTAHSKPKMSSSSFEVSEHSDLYTEMHSNINSAITRVKKYVEELLKKGVRKPAAVFDIDETVLQYVENFKGDEKTEYARTIRGMRNFIKFLRENGVAIRFITARRESGREITIKDLKKLNLFEDKDILMMKPNHYPSRSSSIAKHFQRSHIAEDMGHTIILNVGDQMSDMLPESDWEWFTSVVLKLPDCTLKKMIQQHATNTTNATKILERTMSECNHHLVFLWLETNVAVSWKLPNTKWYTV